MGSIDFEGSQIFYRKVGEGKALLLGHSYLWDSTMWDNVVAELSKMYCCITVDLPGHGRSAPLEDISLEKLSDIHKAVMLHEGFRTFSLAGLSIGAMWGALLVMNKEVIVDKFIILNSSLTPEPLEAKQKYLDMLSLIEQVKAIPEPIIDVIAPGFFSELKAPQFLSDYKQYLKEISRGNIYCIAQVGRCFVNRGNLLNNLSGYFGELCVIAGEFDKYRSLEESKTIATYTNSTLKVVAAGHISAIEEPQLIADLIHGFLK